MKKVVIGIVVLAFLAGGAYVALGRRGASADALPAAPVLPAVKADHKVVADAKVVPALNAALSFPAGGIVGEVLVAEGDGVKEGQLLLRLESKDLQARVQQAQAGLAAAEANLATAAAGARPQEVAAREAAVERAQTSYEAEKTNLERIQLLFTQGAVSQQQLEQATAAYQVAQAGLRQSQAELDLLKAGARPEAVAAAEANVAVARAALEQAKIALAQAELRAPFAGTVVSVNLKQGEFVAPGTPVVQVADLSSWEVQTSDLTEIGVVQIREGNPVTITFDAIQGLELPGKVARIKALGENKQGDITYTVTIKPDRQDERLRWNMTATVVIERE